MADDTTDIGSVDDFPEGEFRVVQNGAGEVGVVRLADGSFRAIANRCPHRFAPLCAGAVGGTLMPCEPGEAVFGMDSQVVRCPWHGYEFSLETGECLFTGLGLRARVYAVEVREGRVLLGRALRRDEISGD